MKSVDSDITSLYNTAKVLLRHSTKPRFSSRLRSEVSYALYMVDYKTHSLRCKIFVKTVAFTSPNFTSSELTTKFRSEPNWIPLNWHGRRQIRCSFRLQWWFKVANPPFWQFYHASARNVVLEAAWDKLPNSWLLMNFFPTYLAKRRRKRRDNVYDRLSFFQVEYDKFLLIDQTNSIISQHGLSNSYVSIITTSNFLYFGRHIKRANWIIPTNNFQQNIL